MATIAERTGVRVSSPGVELPEPMPEGKVNVVLMAEDRARYVWGLLRMGVGWIFLWAFFDKVFGLGYATASDGAWINGGSPTFGFLNFGAKGPFAEGFKVMAGNAAVDWLFMVGLLAIGLALVLGIGVIIASIAGIAMAAMMYAAGFMPPEHNPFMDEHILYVLIFAGLPLAKAGYTLGLGKLWAKTPLVRRYPILE